MTNKQPIDNIIWLDARTLKANDYNPNVVLNQELKLLEFSLLKNGWIQPILITQDHEIIDGYHRYWLSCNSKELSKVFNHQVPCAVLELNDAERMMLTVRINRAKGNHVAVKMHDLITELHLNKGIPKPEIAQGIGSSIKEVELLLQENVFTKQDIKNHSYSKAWIPKKTG